MKQLPWVLVTGGARRLGREFCLTFAKAGWHVVCHYHQSEGDAKQTQADAMKLGVNCQLIGLDLSAPDAANQLLDRCVELTGTLPTCLVNNASLFEADTAHSANAETMARHFFTNTSTPLLLGNALAYRLPEQGTSPTVHSIIHVLDQKVHNLNPDYFSYTVSKLALERSVALQAQGLAPKVRVCGLSPGLLYLSGPQSQTNFDQASQINLLRHAIDPTNVARAAVFVAENTGMTGCTLRVDNGQHLVPLRRDVMFEIDPGAQP